MRRISLMLIAVGLMSAASQAALLGVVQNNPDILADFITVQYNSTTQVFSATGFPESLDLPGGASPDFDLSTVGVSFTTWTLTMNVNNAGVMSSGSISIGGSIPGFGGPTLLTGSLDAYGSVALVGDDKFDFIFTTTGGTLASIYGPKFGVLLDAGDSSFTGSFATDFDNLNEIFGGIADTSKIPVAVPSPMAAPAGLIMLGLLSGFRRSRDRQ